MSYTDITFLVQHDNIEEAIEELNEYLEDQLPNIFYDHFEILEKDASELTPTLIKELKKELKDLSKTKLRIQKNIDTCKKEKNPVAAGHHHKILGKLLAQDLCEEAPFFNIKNEDYSIPTIKENCFPWFTIPVSLHS